MADGTRYDLVVIGAGPGGYVAAIRAAQLGMRVACVEKAPALGGTCLRIGCIPSKALLDSSELFWTRARHWRCTASGSRDVTLDLPAMMARKDKVVRGLTQGVGRPLQEERGRATSPAPRASRAPGRVEVAGHDGQVLEAERILIATGSEPARLPGFDLRRAAHRVLRGSLWPSTPCPRACS